MGFSTLKKIKGYNCNSLRNTKYQTNFRHKENVMVASANTSHNKWTLGAHAKLHGHHHLVCAIALQGRYPVTLLANRGKLRIGQVERYDHNGTAHEEAGQNSDLGWISEPVLSASMLNFLSQCCDDDPWAITLLAKQSKAYLFILSSVLTCFTGSTAYSSGPSKCFKP